MGNWLSLVLLFAALLGETALQEDHCNEGILAVNPRSISPGRLFTLTTAYPVQNISGEGNFSDGYMCTLVETDSEACDNTTCVQQARCQDRGELLVPDNAFVNLSLLLQLPIPEDEEGDLESDEKSLSSSDYPVCYGSVQVFWNQNGELCIRTLLYQVCGTMGPVEPLCNCVVPQPCMM